MQQSPVLAKPVLVGRKKELTKLQRSLEATLEGNGTSFFISGVAGSGKTRLTNEFLNMAKKKGSYDTFRLVPKQQQCSLFSVY